VSTLTGVRIHVDVGNDGLDFESTFQTKLYYPTESDNIADETLAHYQLKPGGTYDKDLVMHTNTFDMADINKAVLYLEINAIGHDSFQGNLTATFSDSDGRRWLFGYGGFNIGTYHQSHTTRKTVSIHMSLSNLELLLD
jgi:hypothetical protein